MVTDRLNFVIPDWTYTVEREFEKAHPEGNFWVLGNMTIGGVTRPEYGNGHNPKDAIANFICRGAMRFGVALDLWQKQDGEASSSPAQVTPTPSGVVSGRDGGERGAGEADDGEAPADPAPPSTPSAQHDGHEHNWKPSPTMTGWQWCDVKGCGKARKKPVVVREVVEVKPI